MAQMSKTQRRFIEGKGQRYTGNGKIRCQAVGKNKLRRLRIERNNPDLTPDEAWPDAQCVFGARPGYYACRYHGGGNRGGPVSGTIKVTEKGLAKYVLKKSLGQMYKDYVEDPTLFEQRQNAALLSARNAELLTDLASAAMGDQSSFKLLVKATEEIKKGNVTGGTALLDKVIDQVSSERAAWSEIRQNVTLIKDLTTAEMNRLKEMRHMLTADQVLNKFEQFSDVVMDAIDRYVENPETREKMLRLIVGGSRDFIGASGSTLIEQVSS